MKIWRQSVKEFLSYRLETKQNCKRKKNFVTPPRAQPRGQSKFPSVILCSISICPHMPKIKKIYQKLVDLLRSRCPLCKISIFLDLGPPRDTPKGPIWNSFSHFVVYGYMLLDTKNEKNSVNVVWVIPSYIVFIVKYTFCESLQKELCLIEGNSDNLK